MINNIIKLIPTEIKFGKNEFRYKWLTYNDTAIGGKSISKIEQYDNHLTFRGNLKYTNKAAWSCLRSKKQDQDLSMYTSIAIKLKSDGLPLAFQMEYQEGWQDEKISCVIHTIPDEWTTVHLSIVDFHPIRFGEIVPGKLNTSVLHHILRYNFYVSSEVSIPFRLEIESIQFS
jgi:hypothetical protein